MRPLNFATRPFRNERLPMLLFSVASAVLLGATVHHAFVVRALLPARTSKLHQEVAGLERELDQLRAENRTLTAPKVDKQSIEEWVVLKDLVDRRTFSWTGLFARLEQVLPRQVKLVSIAPDVSKGEVVLDILAVAQPASAGLSLVGVLEQRPEFEDVYPVNLNEGESGAAEFSYKMRYLPDATPDDVLAAEAAAASATPEDAGPEPAALPALTPLPRQSAPPLPLGKPVAALPASAPRPTPAAPAAGAPDKEINVPTETAPRPRPAPPVVRNVPVDAPPPNEQSSEQPDPDAGSIRVISKKPQPQEKDN